MNARHSDQPTRGSEQVISDSAWEPVPPNRPSSESCGVHISPLAHILTLPSAAENECESSPVDAAETKCLGKTSTTRTRTTSRSGERRICQDQSRKYNSRRLVCGDA